ncbi:hypothetical protein PaeBR_04175 [Paenibacillus sp. BR2-3]|uniref:hypothetical protein n=1 Tax=Paenibacillus sp. BR2-3 TaxID=3048494 RepID=UPI003977B310
MNKKWLLPCVLTLALVSTPFVGISYGYAQEVDTSILTTTQLRNLPPLKETDRIEPTGKVKEFTLDIKEGKWELVKGTSVDAITVNGSIPGPEN